MGRGYDRMWRSRKDCLGNLDVGVLVLPEILRSRRDSGCDIQVWAGVMAGCGSLGRIFLGNREVGVLVLPEVWQGFWL